MSFYLEFDTVVRRFEAAKLRYAVAGGLAVGLHGFIRATEDMDFLIDSADSEQAEAILLKLGYRRNPECQSLPRAGLTLWRFHKRLPKQYDLSVVDLLVPTAPRVRKILERALPVKYGAVTVRVVTSVDLVTMKQRRGSATDKADIEFLKRKP